MSLMMMGLVGSAVVGALGIYKANTFMNKLGENTSTGMVGNRRLIALVFGMVAVALVVSAALMEDTTTAAKVVYAALYVLACGVVYLAVCSMVAAEGGGCIQNATEFFVGKNAGAKIEVQKRQSAVGCFPYPWSVIDALDKGLNNAFKNKLIKENEYKRMSQKKPKDPQLREWEDWSVTKHDLANRLVDMITRDEMTPTDASQHVYGLCLELPYVGKSMPPLPVNEGNCETLELLAVEHKKMREHLKMNHEPNNEALFDGTILKKYRTSLDSKIYSMYE
jgi:hypothetical protein